MNKLVSIVDAFKSKKILVIGDIMLDKYIWGDVTRISPEAPVQVVEVSKESYAPGGAANVANNISAFGADAHMLGLCGHDDTCSTLLGNLKGKNINVDGIVLDPHRPTIQKVRVVGKNQQLLRFDYEKKGYIDASTEEKLVNQIKNKIDDCDAVIVSDYAKGVISRSLMEKLIPLCKNKGKIVVVDPKPHHQEFYVGATLITPNHKEAHQMSHIGEQKEENSDADVELLGTKLCKDLQSNLLITRGEKGMSLFQTDGTVTHTPTYAKEVFDIVGAGDTSIATLTLSLAAGATLPEAAIIANHAAGITVGKIGTSTVSIEELKESIQNE